MLDAVIDLLPSPLDVQPAAGIVPGTDEEVVREPDPSAPFSALAFKVMSDPYVGRLTYMRVYSGTVGSGSGIVNATKDRKERVGRLLMMHANREDVDSVSAGDIVAAVGLKSTTTGDTLTDAADPVILERMTFPEPVIGLAIEPKTKQDQEKLWPRPSAACRTRTRPSASAPTRRPARRSSPAWASCTSRSSSTA